VELVPLLASSLCALQLGRAEGHDYHPDSSLSLSPAFGEKPGVTTPPFRGGDDVDSPESMYESTPSPRVDSGFVATAHVKGRLSLVRMNMLPMFSRILLSTFLCPTCKASAMSATVWLGSPSRRLRIRSVRLTSSSKWLPAFSWMNLIVVSVNTTLYASGSLRVR
jgi:hypothetical protein